MHISAVGRTALQRFERSARAARAAPRPAEDPAIRELPTSEAREIGAGVARAHVPWDDGGVARPGDSDDSAAGVQLARERRVDLARVRVADDNQPPAAQQREQRLCTKRSQLAAPGRPTHAFRGVPMAKPEEAARVLTRNQRAREEGDAPLRVGIRDPTPSERPAKVRAHRKAAAAEALVGGLCSAADGIGV